MAITATSTPSLNIDYTLVNSEGFATTTESTSIGYTSLAFNDGTGTGHINIGAVQTGYISSGETIHFDFQQFSKQVWGSEVPLDFSSTSGTINPERGIKAIIITNSWNSSLLPTGADNISQWSGIVLPNTTGLSSDQLPRLNIHATGSSSAVSGGFTSLFNGESGNISLNPQSTWSFTDTVGRAPIYNTSTSKYEHVVSITTENFSNISGSGGLNSGTSGEPVYYQIWNDFSGHVDAKGEPAVNPWSGNLPRLSYEILVVGVTGS